MFPDANDADDELLAYYLLSSHLEKEPPVVEVEFVDEDFPTSTPVHRPVHYLLSGLDNRTDLQWLDVRTELLNRIPTDMPYTEVVAWSECITYLARMWNKNGLEDAEKALFYLQKLITEMKSV